MCNRQLACQPSSSLRHGARSPACRPTTCCHCILVRCQLAPHKALLCRASPHYQRAHSPSRASARPRRWCCSVGRLARRLLAVVEDFVAQRGQRGDEGGVDARLDFNEIALLVRQLGPARVQGRRGRRATQKGKGGGRQQQAAVATRAFSRARIMRNACCWARMQPCALSQRAAGPPAPGLT